MAEKLLISNHVDTKVLHIYRGKATKTDGNAVKSEVVDWFSLYIDRIGEWCSENRANFNYWSTPRKDRRRAINLTETYITVLIVDGGC